MTHDLALLVTIFAPILIGARLAWRVHNADPTSGRVADPRDDDIFVN